MERRKVVLVIVEGPSDEMAIGIPLKQFFDESRFMVHVVHGDITSQFGVNAGNIKVKLNAQVKEFEQKNHLKLKEDFAQIIHIVDMDGAFLDENHVIEDSNCDTVKYTESGIYTNCREKILSRNERKKQNLSQLRYCKEIRRIPYSIYYMSCNLEHVLFNKLNCTDEEKEKIAHQFAKQYKDDKKAFEQFICNSSFSVKGDFRKSWDFIEKDLHSIERYSNLGLCLEKKV